MKTIAIASGKGGVGKSTVTTQIASLLASNGYKVGVIDADIYGPCQFDMLNPESTSDNTTGDCSEEHDLGLEVNQDNKILPKYSNTHKIHYISVSNIIPNSQESAMLWRAPIATKLIRQFLQQVAWPELDFLFIDLPPGTGDIHITIAQLAKLDGALIVTTPQKVAYKVAAKAIQMFNKVNIEILGIIENMSGYICNNCNHENHIFNHNTDNNGGQVLANKYNSNLLATIPLSSSLVDISDSGKSVANLPDTDPVKINYLKLIENFLLKTSANIANSIQYNTDNKTKHSHEVYKLINSSTLQINTDTSSVNLSAYDLRLNCQCALCKEETTGRNLINKNIISKDITIYKIHEVGNYGLRLSFSDGHDTGIYQINSLEQTI